MRAVSLRTLRRCAYRVGLAALSLCAGAAVASAGPVAAGCGVTVVAMPEQTVVAWGANGSGQLGQGTRSPRPSRPPCRA